MASNQKTWDFQENESSFMRFSIQTGRKFNISGLSFIRCQAHVTVSALDNRFSCMVLLCWMNASCIDCTRLHYCTGSWQSPAPRCTEMHRIQSAAENRLYPTAGSYVAVGNTSKDGTHEEHLISYTTTRALVSTALTGGYGCPRVKSGQTNKDGPKKILGSYTFQRACGVKLFMQHVRIS